MQKLDKHDVIIQKVNDMKRGQFKATGIKVELEAQFSRGRNECDYCDGYRQRYCPECDGNWEDRECPQCEGNGIIANPNPAEGDLRIDCPQCAGDGLVNCGNCDEGRVDCEECPEENWGSDSICHNFIMERLEGLGLAERGEEHRLSHNQATDWYSAGALKYGEFYRDGSVDSEFTFTISLEDPENIYLLPKVIDIWNQLGIAIGNGVNLNRAGMHMALINDPNCLYPTEQTAEHLARFKNFRKSMSLLLPALYFLGSPDEHSRGLEFREPKVGVGATREQKYSAIFYNGGALEFRVFNTCYDNPEAILDNVAVMANCLRYWTKQYKPSGLQRITPSCTFGVEGGDKLERFYATTQHIDLLNNGLKKLKPAYYTVRELKRQRNFGMDKRKVNNRTAIWRKELEQEYKDYEKRWGWDMLVRKQRVTADLIENEMYRRETANDSTRQVMLRVNKRVKDIIGEYKIQPVEEYVKQKLSDKERSCQGRYRLEESAPPSRGRISPDPEVQAIYNEYVAHFSAELPL